MFNALIPFVEWVAANTLAKALVLGLIVLTVFALVGYARVLLGRREEEGRPPD